MPYKPISDYGVIGDMHSAALVGIDGSIDWACFPRFDSPSVFAAILDDNKGGRFSIAPVGECQHRQRYLRNTNILATTFTTDSGEAELLDFMPISGGNRPGESPHEIHRLARCTTGTVELRCLFQPRFDYARAQTTLRTNQYGTVATGHNESIALSTDISLTVDGNQAEGYFTLHEGETATFVLSYGERRVFPVHHFDTSTALIATQTHWQTMADEIQYHGPCKDMVVRSFLLLHLLMYSSTGAIVAAPTTSLPAKIGGQRNWDYRYSWLRDSAFTIGALYRLGDTLEAPHFFNWLLSRCDVTMGDTRIVYGIDPLSDLSEQRLDHLDGYKGSRPVRIGNLAVSQLQMDVFGEVIFSIAAYHKHGGHMSPEAWSIVESFAMVVCKNWHRPDRSIWEIRGHPRHFVYSKIMCWTALDQAVSMAHALGRGHTKEIREWERTADAIKTEILTQGWNQRKEAFTQAYESDHMDGANLIIPMVGILPNDDPRVLSTIQQIQDELSHGALVSRYQTATGVDGLPGDEGAFTMLSFWLIEALMHVGKVDEATEFFEEMIGYSNHLGLFSEMIDPSTKESLGNFPQAFSHVGLIHAAYTLTDALNMAGP